MSWRYPKHRTQEHEALDFEVVNRAFYTFTHESAGGLSEHNFQTGAITAQEDVIAGAGFQIDRFGVNSAATFVPLTVVGDDNVVAVPQTRNWETVSLTKRTLTVEGGLVWIIGTLQAQANASTSGTITKTEAASWGIAVDGSVIPESVLGGFEESNETFKRNADVRVVGTIGFQRWAYPVAVDALVEVSAGVHTFSIVGKSDEINLGNSIKVFDREIIVIQMFGDRTL